MPVIKVKSKEVKIKVPLTTLRIEPTTQSKTVEPSIEEQLITPDEGIFALSSVTVNPIPDEYIIPSGEIKIIENGEYDITNKATAKVEVPEPTGTLEIKANGVYNVKDKEFADVNVPEKKLGIKTITKNGIYKASDDNLDGYSKVNVETSGVDINDYFTAKQRDLGSNYIKSTIKRLPSFVYELLNGYKWNYRGLFAYMSNLEEVELFDMTGSYSARNMFASCSSLKELPAYDFSNISDCYTMCHTCSSLTTIPKLNCVKIQDFTYAFSYCKSLTTLGGFENLGQAYLTTQNENYAPYQLKLDDSPKLTYESLMNVINNLYDIATAGVKPQQLILGSTNLAKLTSEEGQQALANATAKGWTVS